MNAFLLLSAHCFGDFVLQNHWMQAKTRSSWHCTVHVLCYAVPFIFLALFKGLPWWALSIILAEHWLQDRYSLHVRWMRFYGQTSPAQWPLGPLCLDQAFHITFLGLVACLL